MNNWNAEFNRFGMLNLTDIVCFNLVFDWEDNFWGFEEINYCSFYTLFFINSERLAVKGNADALPFL